MAPELEDASLTPTTNASGSAEASKDDSARACWQDSAHRPEALTEWRRIALSARNTNGELASLVKGMRLPYGTASVRKTHCPGGSNSWLSWLRRLVARQTKTTVTNAANAGASIPLSLRFSHGGQTHEDQRSHLLPRMRWILRARSPSGEQSL